MRRARLRAGGHAHALLRLVHADAHVAIVWKPVGVRALGEWSGTMQVALPRPRRRRARRRRRGAAAGVAPRDRVLRPQFGREVSVAGARLDALDAAGALRHTFIALVHGRAAPFVAACAADGCALDPWRRLAAAAAAGLGARGRRSRRRSERRRCGGVAVVVVEAGEEEGEEEAEEAEEAEVAEAAAATVELRVELLSVTGEDSSIALSTLRMTGGARTAGSRAASRTCSASRATVVETVLPPRTRRAAPRLRAAEGEAPDRLLRRRRRRHRATAAWWTRRRTCPNG